MSDDLPDDYTDGERTVKNIYVEEPTKTSRKDTFCGKVLNDGIQFLSWNVGIDNFTQEGIVVTYINHMIMLLEKNKRYGNSALEPLGVFHQESSGQGLLVRIDDKLNRIKNSKVVRKNDVADLVGYLMLFMVQQDWCDFSEMID